MLIYSIIILILSTAVNNNRDSSILFSRITILALITSLIVLSINLNFNFIDEGIILYGGLFMIKSHIFVFILFILILSIFIIGLNSFNLRKKLPSIFPYWNKESHTTLPNIKKIEQNNTEGDKSSFSYDHKIRENYLKKLNIMTHEYRIIEYPLIILFCLTGAIFLLCSYDIVSIFLLLNCKVMDYICYVLYIEILNLLLMQV